MELLWRKDVFFLVEQEVLFLFFSSLENEEIASFFHITDSVWRLSEFLLLYWYLYIFQQYLIHTCSFFVSGWPWLCIPQEQEISNLRTSDFRLMYGKAHRSWLMYVLSLKRILVSIPHLNTGHPGRMSVWLQEHKSLVILIIYWSLS